MFWKRILTAHVLMLVALPVAYSGRVQSEPLRADQQGAVAPLIVNIEVTDQGFFPAFVSIPVGRPIQLVVRNRGSREHHYHIVGLEPSDLLWLTKEEPLDPPVDAHAAHHGGELVPYHICKSGVCPIGVSVHTHANPGDIDVVIFTATSVGTFEVVCPLHPEITGTVVVF